MPNRALFDIALNQQLALCRRYKTTLAVLYIDIEVADAEPDTVSEESEDADVLLRHISMRIKNSLRAPDMAARLDRDHFAIVLIHSDVPSATIFANQLFDILSEPYQLGRITATISASIGIAGYPVTGRDGPTLLKYADDAMHKAKTLGERRVCIAW
ncbi:GGDEF domain-containing protein [Glaciimonas sp. CA11.2]|nr:GGDEF domain-containing protein [Glaciimonas sp. CA11.2]MDY7548287.1 GGDEF domain-containing protein [Glaciimonas sp. CA11.2]MEB0165187.1 GGDEF domain-containing protein [Glaciimonas sp. CA11.2]